MEKEIEAIYVEEYEDRSEDMLSVLYSDWEVDELCKMTDLVDFYGARWVDGKDWTDGRDWADWRDGVDWTNGINGKDWSPDTAQEIVSKLQSLSWDERLSANAIKWLEKFMGYVGWGASTLSQLRDVYLNNISNGDIITWDSGRWQFVNVPNTTGNVWGTLTWNLSDQTDLRNELNSKVTNSRTISTSSPLQWWGDLSIDRTISIAKSDSSTDGYLSIWDRNTFNNKQNFILPWTVNEYWRWDKTRANLSADVLSITSWFYEVPLTFSTWLTRTGDTIEVNDVQNIIRLSNLNTDWFVKTILWDGTLVIDTSTYLTTISWISAGGELSWTYPNPTVLNSAVISKLLTWYSSGAWVITSSDSILQAIQKLNGNIGALTTWVSSVFWRTGVVVSQSWDYTTTQVTEATNLYFTEARVRSTTLSWLSISWWSITSSDSIITAFGKVQNQINGVLWWAIYQGTWNASTNTPTLTSSVGTKGYYYVVSVAWSTNLDWITSWSVWDWAIFNGTTWDKVDNTDAVSSVNGSIGAVSLTGTTNKITVTWTVWDISSSYAGQPSITTLGTITSWIWNATSIQSQYWGTGINTSSSTGIAQVLAGTWSVSTALANGTTATTQTAWTNNTTIATTAFIATALSWYIGSTSITTLGTITTGVWNGTAIANANLANSSITFTTGSSGSDLNWSSSPVSLGGTATVNIPSMAATSVTRGLLTNTTQTLPGDKTFNSGTLTVTKTGGGDSKLVMQNSGFTGDFAFLTIGNSAVSRVGIRSESTDKATYLYAMPNGAGVLNNLNSTFSLFTTDFYTDSTNTSFMQMQAGVGLMGINMRNGGTGTLENFNFLFNSTVTATLTTAGLLGVGTSTGTSAPDYRLTLVGTNATTPQINLRSSRSAIVATNVIGGVIFTSNDTNLTAPGTEVASFQALAAATHTASVLTTDFVWKGTNTLAYAETMRLTGEGLLGIGVAPTKGWLEIKAGTTTRSAITLTAGTNKTSSVAGDLEYDGTQIYFTNGGAVRQTIQQVQRARVASAFARTSSTTLTNITGLSVTVVAGKTYEIYAVIPTTSALSGGVKFAIGGTCTATTINYTGTTQDAAGGATYMSKSAALGGTVGEQSNVTNAETVIRGEIIVNAGGTLTVQFGQNTSNASSSTCTVGGQFVVTQIA